MKRRKYFFRKLLAIFLLLTTGADVSLHAAPTTPPPKPAIVKSVFILPSNPREGRDPFFPNSDRPYREYSVTTNVNAPSVSDLVVKTILTTPDGHAFAIINNHTFAPGDDGDVLSKDGMRRMHIHCLAINPRNSTVTVESSGVTVTLTFTGVQ